jgi:hypothetical protein
MHLQAKAVASLRQETRDCAMSGCGPPQPPGSRDGAAAFGGFLPRVERGGEAVRDPYRHFAVFD